MVYCVMVRSNAPPRELRLVEVGPGGRVPVAREERGVLEQRLGGHDGRGTGELQARLNLGAGSVRNSERGSDCTVKYTFSVAHSVQRYAV